MAQSSKWMGTVDRDEQAPMARVWDILSSVILVLAGLGLAWAFVVSGSEQTVWWPALQGYFMQTAHALQVFAVMGDPTWPQFWHQMQLHAGHIGVVVALAVGCIGLGHMVLGRLGLLFESRISGCVGAGACGMVLETAATQIVGSVGLYGAWLAWLFVGVVPALAVVGFVRSRPRRVFVDPLTAGWERLLVLVFALVCTLTFVLALEPIHTLDALVYHMVVPKVFSAAGGIVEIPDNFYTYSPLNGELVFLHFVTLGLDDAARLWHWLLGVGSALAAFAIVRTYSGRDLALAAALVTYTMPTLMMRSAAAYTDLFVLLYTLVAALFFLRYCEERSWQSLVVSALLLGFAAGSKYTALYSCAAFVAAALLTVVVLKRVPWRHLVLFGLVSGVAGAFWFGRNLLLTGNPLFPVGESEPPLSYVFADVSTMAGSVPLWRMFVDLPLWGTFFDGHDGAIGFMFLFMWLALAWVRPRWRAQPAGLVFLVALFLFAAGFWAQGSQQLRFYLVAASIQACVFFTLVTARKPAVLFTCIVAALLNVGVFTALAAPTYPLAYALGGRSKEALLRQTIRSYDAIGFLNRQLTGTDKVLLFGLGGCDYLLERNGFNDTLYEGFTLNKLAEEAESPLALLATLSQRGFTHMAFRKDMVDPATGLCAFSGLALSRIHPLLGLCAAVYEDPHCIVFLLPSVPR